MSQTPVTDLKMLAKATFDNLIYEIQESGLNYTMQITPYSATISLKKSFVTDRNGLTVIPFQAKEIVEKVGKKQLETNYRRH